MRDRNDTPTPQRRWQVVFLCYGNACRSQMAEAFARQRAADLIEARSAGVSPLGYIPPEVTIVLEEVGVPCEGQWSKSLPEAQSAGRVDLIVDLADVLSAALDATPIRRMKVVDPFGGDLNDYRRSRDAVWETIEPLIESLRGTEPPP